MKSRINICHIYFLVILLVALNGTLYAAGGIVAQGLQYILILMSLYYVVYANSRYRLPGYYKALNVLLIMFTVYGMLLIFGGERLMVQYLYLEASNTGYLKIIYESLLPLYPFYVFTKKGYLKESNVKFWFFIFFILSIKAFVSYRLYALRAASDMGLSLEEITNNVGYSFVALLPGLVLFYKKPVIQYLGLGICSYFIITSMKRGAILCGVICLLWFMITNLKQVQKKRRWVVVIATVTLVVSGIFLFNYLMGTSAYFQARLAQSESGDLSGRDNLYSLFFNHFIHEDNPLRFVFGNGANATLKIGPNYAHNDWLEIAINQGMLGLIIYFIYWVVFIITWRKTKQNQQAFMAVGMFIIIFFLSSLFSASYNSVSRCAAMILSYYLADYNNKEVMLSR